MHGLRLMLGSIVRLPSRRAFSILFWYSAISCAVIVGGLGSFALGMFTTNLSSQSVRLSSADTGEIEEFEWGLDSVVVSVLSDRCGVVSLSSRLTQESPFFLHFCWLSELRGDS
jgi:hypothetical protein